MPELNTQTNTSIFNGFFEKLTTGIVPAFASRSGNAGTREVSEREPVSSTVSSYGIYLPKKKSIFERIAHSFKVSKNYFIRTANTVHTTVGGIIATPFAITGLFAGFTVSIIAAPVVGLITKGVNLFRSSENQRSSACDIMKRTISVVTKKGIDVGAVPGAILGGVIGKGLGILAGIPAFSVVSVVDLYSSIRRERMLEQVKPIEPQDSAIVQLYDLDAGE